MLPLLHAAFERAAVPCLSSCSFELLIAFSRGCWWLSTTGLAGRVGRQHWGQRRWKQSNVCPHEQVADGECIISPFCCSASMLCSALWLGQAGVYPSSAGSCPDPLPDEVQEQGPMGDCTASHKVSQAKSQQFHFSKTQFQLLGC